MALEAERELEFRRRFTGEVDVGTCVYILNCCFIFRFVSSPLLYFALNSLVSGFDLVRIKCL